MSGIAGVLRFDGHPAESERVKTMIAAMARRGPDGIEHWSAGSVALGHLMLHTTAESLAERQPLVSADGQRVLVVHGRIDNRDELAGMLAQKRVAPLDNSDAALFLAAYECWGDDFPDRIEGDFALVLWDARRRAAICARDRVGAKPFVYHWDGRRFAFASDVRAVLELPWVEQELDEAKVAQYLMNDLRSFEDTFWRGVRRLAPGHRMIVTADGPRSGFYWTLDLGRRLRYRREEEYVEHYRALLDDVLRRMSRSHRALAFQVSGGLDSSALFAVADGLERQGRLPAPGLDGYTLHFDDGTPANELRYVRDVASHLRRPVQEIEPVHRPLEWYEAEARTSHDFPPTPNVVMLDGLLAAAAAAGSKVVIRGVGGDEILSGTRERYAEAILRGEITSLPRMAAADWRDLGPVGAARKCAVGGVFPLLPGRVRRLIRRAWEALPGRRPPDDWLSPRLTAFLEALPDAPPTPLAGVLFESQRPMLRWICHPLLAQGLEMEERRWADVLDFRDPFCNAGLISFFASVPERFLSQGASTKHLHRRALDGRLPASVLERKDKAEFSSIFGPLVPQIRARISDKDDPLGFSLVKTENMEEHLAAFADSPYMSLEMWRIWFLAACAPLARGQSPCRRRLMRAPR